MTKLHPGRVTRITEEEARAAVQAFANMHFNNAGPRSRATIPAHKDDTDVLLMDYITQREAEAGSAGASSEPPSVGGAIGGLLQKWDEDAAAPISKHASPTDREVMESVKAETRACARELRRAVREEPTSSKTPTQPLPDHLPDEWEMCAALMQNNQLEQLLSGNWKCGENPASNLNIKTLAMDIAKLIYESFTHPAKKREEPAIPASTREALESIHEMVLQELDKPQWSGSDSNLYQVEADLRALLAASSAPRSEEYCKTCTHSEHFHIGGNCEMDACHCGRFVASASRSEEKEKA